MMAGILVGTFKLTCVGDRTVLDVPESNTQDKTRIITYGSYHGGKNQKWIGTASDPKNGIVIGGTLKTALDTGTPKVLDASSSIADAVVVWGLHGQIQQLWVAVPVQGQPDQCVIRSLKTGKCIRSSGSSQPVTLVAEDHKDLQQRWTYTLV